MTLHNNHDHYSKYMGTPISNPPVLFQGILNQDAVDIVNDLTVPSELLAEAKKEAQSLPQLEISTLDLQWVQVADILVL